MLKGCHLVEEGKEQGDRETRRKRERERERERTEGFERPTRKGRN